jgi:Fe-S-cluster-containing dehydrogenase component
MKLSRRNFLRIAGATGGAGLLAKGSPALASTGEPGAEERAVLVDTTLCKGCRACEAACSEANHNPAPPPAPEVLDTDRRTSPGAFTVVNRAGENAPDGSRRFAKQQCMHCVAPGCASACPVKAIEKQPSGPVTYDATKCMGCRYCMVACPFGVPKYEYEALAPRVRKCTFCFERQLQGKGPACVEVCPTGALKFGTRAELLDEAKRRVYGTDRYVAHVYGEHEAGGTNWLYVSDVPFEKLALPTNVETLSYPNLVKGALGAPPFVMTLWPPLLMGLYAFSKRRDAAKHEEKEDGHGHH